MAQTDTLCYDGRLQKTVTSTVENVLALKNCENIISLKLFPYDDNNDDDNDDDNDKGDKELNFEREIKLSRKKRKRVSSKKLCQLFKL